MSLLDDLGAPVDLPTPPRRVVSLVPSLTEAVALSAPGALVGATAWCTHPGDLDVPRFGGTKNPNVEGILAARPDLVVANEEENKLEHVEALRAAGVPVWVTDIRTVEGAFISLERLLDVLAAPERAWLDQARANWAALPSPVVRRSALTPIWRRPWMVLGAETYAGDVLRRFGIDNGLAEAESRYPRVDLADVVGEIALVVLPDEPYAFTAEDGPEAFPGIECALVSGRHLTWYGPAMTQAPEILGRQLDAPNQQTRGDHA